MKTEKFPQYSITKYSSNNTMAHKQNIKHSCITKKLYEYIGYGTTKGKIISAYTPDQLQLTVSILYRK
jgi:hypothetical protein